MILLFALISLRRGALALQFSPVRSAQLAFLSGTVSERNPTENGILDSVRAVFQKQKRTFLRCMTWLLCL